MKPKNKELLLVEPRGMRRGSTTCRRQAVILGPIGDHMLVTNWQRFDVGSGRGHDGFSEGPQSGDLISR